MTTIDMATANHERVSKALELLKRGLGPFVQQEFTNTYKDGAMTEASKIITFDSLNAKKPIMEWDVSVLLKLMWESWYNVFRNILGQPVRNLVSELRDHRNRWAHQEYFSTDDTYRVLDSTGRLLTAISASQVNEIEKMKTELRRLLVDEQALMEKRKSTDSAIESSADGLGIVKQRLSEPLPDAVQFKECDVAVINDQESQLSYIPVQRKQSRSETSKSHSQGQTWDHNKPENQDGFINGCIKNSMSIKEIGIAFAKMFPEHTNPVSRVRRHINHLKKDHKDFPFEETSDGKFVPTK